MVRDKSGSLVSVELVPLRMSTLMSSPDTKELLEHKLIHIHSAEGKEHGVHVRG